MRLIDADELVKKWTIASPEPYNTDAVEVLDSIREAPTVDATPVVHGHRIDDGGFYTRCSQCDGVLPLYANYCPNCGAKMDGGANHEAG